MLRASGKRSLTFLIFILLVLASTNCKKGGEGSARAGEYHRRPAVAGQFYPSDKAQLEEMVRGFIDNVSGVEMPFGKVLGVVVPHAGLIYSGQVAAYSYSVLKDKPIETVVMIGPSHYVPFRGASVYAKGEFETPLGDVPIDEDLAHAILDQDPELFTFNPRHHSREHSLEVQLPFLQVVLPDVSIVPIIMGDQDSVTVRKVAGALTEVLKHTDKRVLLLASSDWSHYHPRSQARRLDEEGINTVVMMNPAKLLYKLQYKKTEACGGGPVAAVLITAMNRGADWAKVLKYGDSGDVSGDTSAVVGYAAIAIGTGKETDLPTKVEETKGRFSTSERKKLIEIARTSIKRYLEDGKEPELSVEEAKFKELGAAFVTLERGGRLRGCIGYTIAEKPLYQTVSECAILAATQDPRFRPVTLEELQEIEIEISVLSPLQKVDDVDEIIVGLHGLLIDKGGRRGLLLPQVAVEWKWNRSQFLENVCHKAGLPSDAWREGADIYIFSAEVFREGKE
jgi:AmmeMemoRadiSam system protein B/AmmeMemoRadiSam system protein A